MADDIILNSGDSGGATVATDDDGSRHWQYVKIAFGDDNTYSKVISTASQPLPVALSDTDNAVLDVIAGAIATLGTTTYTETTTTGAVVGAVRNDTLAALAGTDNEIAPLQVNASGALYIQEGSALDVSAATVTVDLGANNDVTLATLPDTAASDLATIETNTDFGTVTGGGVEATALRVTLANDSTGTLSVDNEGSFSVQVTGQPATDIGTIAAAVSTEDAVHGSGDTGIMALAVQQTSDAALAGTSGDYAPLQVDDSGFLKVNIKAGAGSGGTASTDDAAFTAGSGSGTPAMGFFSADTVNAGDVGVLAMDASRRLLCSIEVDNVGIGGGTQYTLGTATYTETTTVGTVAGAVRNDTLAALASTDNEIAPLQVNASGALYVQEGSALDVSAATVTVDLGANNDVTVTGTVTVDLGVNNDVTVTSGSITADLGANNDVTIDGSNSIYTHDAIGGTANGIMVMAQRDDEVGSTQVTSADGDASSLRANKFGAIKVTELPDATSEVKSVVINAASGDNTIVTAAGAGIKIRVLSCVIVSGGTSDCRFESGAAGTALTGIMKLVVNSGFTLPFNPYGWFETADNTLLNLECTADLDGVLTYVEV